MTAVEHIESLAEARALDAADPLTAMRSRFRIPTDEAGQPWLYLCGNSLGLQPVTAPAAIEAELDAWARLGVEGHFESAHPWYSYDEPLRPAMARVVGARPDEVGLMGSLTTNLHLLMVSFYRPTPERFKIVIEAGAFPSDRYAVASQAAFHGFDPDEAIVELAPRDGEATLRTEDITGWLEAHGAQVALVMFGGVNYYTGQALDMAAITAAGHAAGAVVGFDLAHAAGNLALKLHDDGPDFAAWCTYKYLNSGPGAVAGIFVHDRHAHRPDLPRFAGWWGTDPETRFQMAHDFVPRGGAPGWQLSNVPIMSMAPVRASLELFDEATIEALRARSLRLTAALEARLEALDRVTIITPSDPAQRGAQLSLRIGPPLSASRTSPPGRGGAGGAASDRDGDPIAKRLHRTLRERGVICDFRTPDVLRLAPAPLYNTFEDCWRFAETLGELLHDGA